MKWQGGGDGKWPPTKSEFGDAACYTGLDANPDSLLFAAAGYRRAEIHLGTEKERNSAV